MNENIKQKLEQIANKFAPITKECYEGNVGFIAGAETILENPNDWGLKEASQTWFKMVDELTKYREALEKLLEENMCSHAGDELIEEALKQQ